MKIDISEAWFPIDLCFQLTYASKTLAHDPAPNLNIHAFLLLIRIIIIHTNIIKIIIHDYYLFMYDNLILI